MRKYRNIPVAIDGIRFASKKEANRYTELRLMLRTGEIIELKLQPKWQFPIKFDSGRHITYTADFQYIDCDTARVIIEDVKGFRTKVYKIKKAMLKYFNDIDVTEI